MDSDFGGQSVVGSVLCFSLFYLLLLWLLAFVASMELALGFGGFCWLLDFLAWLWWLVWLWAEVWFGS